MKTVNIAVINDISLHATVLENSQVFFSTISL